jgi:hypothetical protein
MILCADVITKLTAMPALQIAQELILNKANAPYNNELHPISIFTVYTIDKSHLTF